MTNKKDTQFLFEVQLDWIGMKKGLLFSHDTEGTLQVATPPEFGGEGRPWTPEHFFLSSISSCFMTTFLAFAEKLDFSITHFECSIIGQVRFSSGGYRFAAIDLFPKISIRDEALREKAESALAKTHKYCIISNSVNAPVCYHSEILVETQPAINNPVCEL